MKIAVSTDDAGVTQRFEMMRSLIAEAGALAHGYFGRLDELTVETKADPQDVVSIADRSVEQFLRERVEATFSGDGFYGEELGRTASQTGYTWVVDPIDGTSCFVAGIPLWGISVALVHDDQVVAGLIYDPNHNELFTAGAGHGATLNGRPIAVARTPSIASGFFSIGACHRVAPDTTLSAIANLLSHGGMFIRYGSAALSLAHVAAGRLTGYFEAHLMPWDCLAGLLIVREAGGRMNDYFDNRGYDRGNVICVWTPDIEGAIASVFDLSQPVTILSEET